MRNWLLAILTPLDERDSALSIRRLVQDDDFYFISMLLFKASLHSDAKLLNIQDKCHSASLNMRETEICIRRAMWWYRSNLPKYLLHSASLRRLCIDVNAGWWKRWYVVATQIGMPISWNVLSIISGIRILYALIRVSFVIKRTNTSRGRKTGEWPALWWKSTTSFHTLRAVFECRRTAAYDASICWPPPDHAFTALAAIDMRTSIRLLIKLKPFQWSRPSSPIIIQYNDRAT